MSKKVKFYHTKAIYRRAQADRDSYLIQSEIHEGLIFAIDNDEIDIITTNSAVRIPLSIFNEMKDIVDEYKNND